MLQISQSSEPKPACAYHGTELKRASCKECHAAYMRDYQRKTRRANPSKDLLRRAKERAAKFGLDFSLTAPPAVPKRCPALGLVLTPGGSRSDTSPALDRINPAEGYIEGNVRVVSDRANRLKGNHTLPHLRKLATTGQKIHRQDFGLIVRYLEREELLAQVRHRAEVGPGNRREWAKIGEFLDRAFERGEAPTEEAK